MAYFFFFSALGWHSVAHTSDGELLSYSYTSWDATVRLTVNDPGDVRAQSTSSAHKVAAFQIKKNKKTGGRRCLVGREVML